MTLLVRFSLKKEKNNSYIFYGKWTWLNEGKHTRLALQNYLLTWFITRKSTNTNEITMKIFCWHFDVVFIDWIVPIAISIGIYKQNIYVGKYRGNPSRNKINLKKTKKYDDV